VARQQVCEFPAECDAVSVGSQQKRWVRRYRHAQRRSAQCVALGSPACEHSVVSAVEVEAVVRELCRDHPRVGRPEAGSRGDSVRGEFGMT
jgi:hypothetical protein